jgi:YHS domain-containing protein
MFVRWLSILSFAVAASVAHAAGLDGYDPVSYFIDGKPLKGNATYTTDYMGEKYHFASARNRDAFVAAPEKYLPQYGGYCAWAAAQNQLAPGDPAVYKVVDGKLYLNYNRDVASRWEKDIPGFIRAADANWPQLAKKR